MYKLISCFCVSSIGDLAVSKSFYRRQLPDKRLQLIENTGDYFADRSLPRALV